MPEEPSNSIVLLPASAILHLISELERLKARTTYLDSRIVEIEIRQDEDCSRLARDIALDRQRLTRLETPPDPKPSMKDRGEILRALLITHGGKMSEKEARQKMRLSKSQFSQLLVVMEKDIEKKLYHSDKRMKILQLK